MASVLLALVLVPLVASQALAIGTLDQEVLPGGVGAVSSSATAWQTFTAGKTGLLDTVSLYGYGDSGAFGPTWNVAIQATTGGTPSGPDLATGSAAAAASPGGWSDITLSPAIAVSAGTMYAIVVSGPTPFWTFAAAAYAGGSDNVSSDDLAFRTYVTPVGVTLASISPTEGAAVNGTVATFTAVDTSLTASDFTATIDWGDGTQTAGDITGSAGSFSVSASSAPHTYADESAAPLAWSVSVTETGYSPVTASGSVTVAEGDVLTGPAAVISGLNEGSTTTASFTFSDTNTNNVASDFTATIDWGDGTTTAGTVSGSAGNYTVSGTHTFADEGSYAITATLTDDGPGTATGTFTAPGVPIADADALSGSLSAIAPVYGTPFSGTVATFSDTYASNVPSDFTATIAWGDGTTTAGTVSGGSGSFAVSGSHTYAAAGLQASPMSVTLTDDAPGTATATVSGPVTVAQAASATTLTVTPNVVTTGHESSAVFSATVASVPPASGTPTGTVVVTSGTTTLCTITLSGGTGTCSLGASPLPAAGTPYTITGTYSGDVNFLSSSSSTMLVVGSPPGPVTSLRLTKGVGASASGPFGLTLTAPLGSSIWYQLSLQNVTSGPLTGVTLVDSAAGGALPAGCPALPASLAAGATYTCTYESTVGAGTTTNTATATAQGVNGATASAIVTAGPAIRLTDAIAAGVNRGTSGFGTSSVILPKPGYVTFLVRLDPSLAGQHVQLWTKTKTGTWIDRTSRLVAADGTVHYFLKIGAWTGFQARLDGGASHGRIATVR